MQSETTDSTRLYELLAWLELNRKRVILAACGVLTVIVLFYIFAWYREQHELQASHALLSLRTPRRGSAEPKTPAPAEFLKVASDFGSTDAAQHATLLAAGAFFAEGKYAEAQSRFQSFLDRNSSSPLASIAALGVATCLDALDRPDAAAAYQSVIDRFAEEAAAVQARLALAALYESQNRPEKALQIYDELGRQTGTGSGAIEASTRRERLLLHHPNLAPTNAASLTTSTVAKPAPSTATNPPSAAPTNPPPASVTNPSPVAATNNPPGR
jgi:predicted negative regulator of RcsB-dependent stress response